MPAHQATPLNPKKLLHTKWTAVVPQRKEKHFLVIAVLEPELPGRPIERIELEAVFTRRTRTMSWRDLTDTTRWRRGWV